MRRFAIPLFFLLLAMPALPVDAQQLDAYSACSFYPQGAGCDQVYQRALKDSSLEAAPVREAFQKYARYLKMPSSGLDDQDRRWLKDNHIRLPALDAADLAGLHNLLHDDTLKNGDEKQAAANNFIAHAVQAELYCRLNSCGTSAPGV